MHNPNPCGGRGRGQKQKLLQILSSGTPGGRRTFPIPAPLSNICIYFVMHIEQEMDSSIYLWKKNCFIDISYCQFSSVAQSCPTLCNPMDCSTPGLPVHHQLLEFTQTHVYWVGDAIQPSHPLSSPSPPPFNLSQHQGLFQWVSSSHQVAKVLEFQLQHQSFQWIFRTDFLEDWLVWSPCSLRVSQESSPIPQFKSYNSSVLSFLYGPTLTSIREYWKTHSFD